MSKDGYLPPGVESWHIPGNRPEDAASDRAWEDKDEECWKMLTEGLTEIGLPLGVEEAISDLLAKCQALSSQISNKHVEEKVLALAVKFMQEYESWIEAEVENTPELEDPRDRHEDYDDEL